MQNTIVQAVQIQLLNASATALTTATGKSLPLPQGVQAGGGLWPQPVTNALYLNPGWWILEWNLNFNLTASTTTVVSGGPSTTTNVAPSIDNGLVQQSVILTTNTGVYNINDELLVNVPAQGLNYFLVALNTFSAGSQTASGYINAYQLAP